MVRSVLRGRHAATARSIAPPSFLFPLNRILSGYVGGLPGIHAMWAGADLEWFEPITRGTEVRTEAYLKELIEHQTRFAGRAIQQIYHVDYYDAAEGGRLLAGGDSWCFRTERDTARGARHEVRGGPPPARPCATTRRRSPTSTSSTARRRCGARSRAPASSVQVGEALPVDGEGADDGDRLHRLRPGLGRPYIRANKLAYQQLRKHPGLGIPDRFGIPDVPERVHWDSDLATLIGTPEAYDYGPERCSWLMHHLTNWMGDDGFLVSHQCRIRHHNVVGDWLTIEGRVTGTSRRRRRAGRWSRSPRRRATSTATCRQPGSG